MICTSKFLNVHDLNVTFCLFHPMMLKKIVFHVPKWQGFCRIWRYNRNGGEEAVA